ncbi:hypothetical protein GCM10023259_082880 [Thermocatellispora tengchongensis]
MPVAEVETSTARENGSATATEGVRCKPPELRAGADCVRLPGHVVPCGQVPRVRGDDGGLDPAAVDQRPLPQQQPAQFHQPMTHPQKRRQGLQVKTDDRDVAVPARHAHLDRPRAGQRPALGAPLRRPAAGRIGKTTNLCSIFRLRVCGC